ncbi:MAG: hypothetical protein IPH44_35150 [Myxococcales bacterium]|nr:hypothetical protein [Myxococcales bacterium]MBK7194672.1 hypothetical protein [Myxococcales bacterium]MBP6842224.1 hypothetical protein [Kofleriaceae bacterium]
MKLTTLLALAAVVAAAPSSARAEDDDGYFALLGAGLTAQADYSGLQIGSYYYSKPSAEGIDRIYVTADANMAAPGLGFDFGYRVFRGLTLGLNFGFYPTSASGPAAPATGTETIGGFGMSAGWIAVQSKRLLVHPIVFVQRAGNEPYYGARWGLEVHAMARVLRLGTLGGRSLYLSAQVTAGTASTTIKMDSVVADQSATYSRTYLSVGVTPIDWSF